MSDKHSKLVSFLWNFCPDVLREMFLELAKKDDSHAKFFDLPSYLTSRKRDIRVLKERGLITEGQFDLLYSSHEAIDMRTLDLGMLLILLLQLFRSNINQRSTDCLNEISDVQNIIGNDELTDQQFESYWTRLETATLDLAKQYIGKDNKKKLQTQMEKLKNEHNQDDKGRRHDWLKEANDQFLGKVERRDFDDGGAHSLEMTKTLDHERRMKDGAHSLEMTKTLDHERRMKDVFSNSMDMCKPYSTEHYAKTISNIERHLRNTGHVVVTGNDNMHVKNIAFNAIKEMDYKRTRCVEVCSPGDWLNIDPKGVDLVVLGNPFDSIFNVEKNALKLVDMFTEIEQARKDQHFALLVITADQNFDRFKKKMKKKIKLLDNVVTTHKSKLRPESPCDSQQLIKEDNEVSEWEKVTTVELAESLIYEDTLPDKHTLCNLVKRLGRKSATVRFVIENICTKIEESTPDVTHVFAAYTQENENGVHFVVLSEDVSSRKSDSFLDHEIVCRNNKGKESESEQIQELMSLSTEESLALKKAINEISKQYMEQYKYLSAITARKIRSEGEHLCIVMYVHPCTERYSSIPITEEPLPNELGGYKVVVRHGVFKTATNNAGEYHAHLRMGCKITSNFVNCHGTLGGFIDHPEYGLCGFTCAHVVFGDPHMQQLKTEKRFRMSVLNCYVYQPSKDSDSFGRVVEAVCTEGDDDSAGVDLALFKIENRLPQSGAFPDSSMDEKYVTGKTLDRTSLSANNCNVIKFGVTTGKTAGKVVFDGMSVKSLDSFTINASGVHFFLFNQYEIVNDTYNFCERGDSGGLVFIKDCTEELVCIGMVHGCISSNEHPSHGVVTPITDILRELKVHRLKTFRENLNVDRFEAQIVATAAAMQNQVRNDMSSMRNDNLPEFSNVMANLRGERTSSDH